MKQCFNEGWKLVYRDLSWTADRVLDILEAQDYIDAGPLPCDVHMPLIREGIIKDPVVADYSYDCEWMERKSWWLRRDFDLSEGDLAVRKVMLVLESLDLFADIFVNGRLVGTHESCHYPFEADVKEQLRPGANSLLVRLTAGPERFSRGDYDYLKDYICTETDADRGDRGEKARAFLRKPQYVFGWDWSPRIATIGIMKNAWLDFQQDVAVTLLHPVTVTAQKDARMRFEVEFDSLLPISTQEAEVTLTVSYEGTEVLRQSRELLAQSGANYVDFDAVIADARLWWPTGAGEQPLYTAQVSIKTRGGEVKGKPVRFGIRTVGLNLKKFGEHDRLFAVQVNGVDLYCKGGDWIPSDSIYARVTPEKYETLIREAKAANFNMLRMWGGGNYERDEFYNLCDEYGILVWQDFMFACSLFPDDQEWFRQLVAKEMHYQTRRLRHHPCIALWCGNNENQWIFQDLLGSGERDVPSGGLHLYNEIAPAIIRANCPEMPYWRSSPYGGDLPNDNGVGNRHHWQDCTMNEDMQKRITPEEYDKVTSRFITEYGYIGPCSEETIQKYYGNNPVVHGDRIWNLHNNTFEKATVPEGIRKHYADPEGLEMADYLRYGRLVQGLMYSYSLEAIRFYPKNSGALFWMYNDTWGEVGWTIIDYYLDRKPSYYYVKRAFAPVKFILRRGEDGKTVRVMGINDTPQPISAQVEYGYAGFDGSRKVATAQLDLPAFRKGIVLEFPLPGEDLSRGVVFLRGAGAPLALLRTGPFRDYQAADTAVTVEKVETAGEDLRVTLSSAGFSHAVSLDLPARYAMDDAFFDMLPGDVRTITLYGAAGTLKAEQLRPVFLAPGG